VHNFNAEPSTVFLSSTLPPESIGAVQESLEKDRNDDQTLIEMLTRDDIEVVYQKQEEKERW
jgi:hypothetical protein